MKWIIREIQSVINTIRYPFKVWITSLLVGTLIFMLLAITGGNHTIFSGIWPMFYVLGVAVGGLFSLPCFMTFWICYHLLLHFNQSELRIRVCLSLFSLVTCSLTLSLFRSSSLVDFWKQDNLVFIAAYAVPLIFGVIVYKLDKPIKMSEVVQNRR